MAMRQFTKKNGYYNGYYCKLTAVVVFFPGKHHIHNMIYEKNLEHILDWIARAKKDWSNECNC
jgi:hypothetical protein